MGKWVGILAVGGAMAFAATMMNRRTGRNMNWNKMWSQSRAILGNNNVRRAMKKGRRMVRSWT